MEHWAAVRDFPKYQISTFGRVRNTKSRLKGDGIIKPANGKYRRATLCRDGVCYRRTISRIMLEAFVGPPPSRFHQAAHNDGNPHNDVISNLRWATPKENSGDRVLHGTLRQGERHGRAKLSAKQVQEIKSRCLAGQKKATLAREFCVCQATISYIALGITWRSV